MPIHHQMLGAVPTDTERTIVALASEALGARSCSVHENVLNPDAIVPWHQQTYPTEIEPDKRAIAGGKEWIDTQMKQERLALPTDFAPVW